MFIGNNDQIVAQGMTLGKSGNFINKFYFLGINKDTKQ